MTKERFWKPFFNRFYRKGATDHCCILKFTGFEAQQLANQRTQTIKLYGGINNGSRR